MRRNKRWIDLVDAWIAILITGLLSLMFYWVLNSFYKSMVKTEEHTYANFALSECAEVVHSFRYWQIDKNGSAWWTNYQNKYPTWIYKLIYNPTAKAWDTERYAKDETNNVYYENFKTLLNDGLWNTEWEQLLMWDKKIKLTRFVEINNDNVEKSNVTCYVKVDNYMYFTNENIPNDESQYTLYNRLKFTMTNY